MLPKAVIFDWDNTLIDVQLSLDFALMRTMDSMGCVTGNEKVISNRALYLSREQFLKDKFEKKWEKANIFYDRYIKCAPLQNVSLLKNAKKVLQFTLDNKIPAVVVSNKFGSSLRREVKQLNLLKYFSSVIGSGDTAEDKPSVMPAIAALDQISMKPNKNIWFIGDTIVDMKCAENLGVTGVLYGSTALETYSSNFYAKDHSRVLNLFHNNLN